MNEWGCIQGRAECLTAEWYLPDFSQNFRHVHVPYRHWSLWPCGYLASLLSYYAWVLYLARPLSICLPSRLLSGVAVREHKWPVTQEMIQPITSHRPSITRISSLRSDMSGLWVTSVLNSALQPCHSASSCEERNTYIHKWCNSEKPDCDVTLISGTRDFWNTYMS